MQLGGPPFRRGAAAAVAAADSTAATSQPTAPILLAAGEHRLTLITADAMAFSAIFVVSNSLRLRRIKLND